MYTLLKPLKVREELLKRGVKVFTAAIFEQIFVTNKDATKYFLETQTKEGLLTRLKRGVYVLKSDPPSEEEIANVLYRPSYISFEYALAYYGIIPEMTYMITSATTKPTRLFTVDSTEFSYRAIKLSAYTGYSLVKKDDRSFVIADKEKAFCDYLYFVSLGKSVLNDRLLQTAKNVIDLKKINKYVDLYESEQLNKLVEKIL